MSNPTTTYTIVLGCAMMLSCQRSEPSKVDSNLSEKVSPVNAALADTAPGQLSSTDTGSTSDELTTVRNVLAPNPVTVGSSLGRTFQGEIVAEVILPKPSEPATLRYMASGERMRMRLDGSASDFDLIADGKVIALINHASHSFQKFDLDKLSGKAPSDQSRDTARLVHTENDEPVTFQSGLRCEDHTFKGPDTEIHACVAGLPGAFERGVFEHVTGIKIPTWLAMLLENDEIPLRARGHAGNSGEFSMTVTRYAAEPLPDESFIVPPNYALKTM
jgi:hypothetical protein